MADVSGIHSPRLKSLPALLAEYKDALSVAAGAQAFEVLPQEAPTDNWLLARVA
jgi:hypothetical protein